MAEHDLLNMSGQSVGKVDLPDAVFVGEIKPHLFHEVVVGQLAARRGGNAKTKERSEVRGGGAKPFRQKGTGRARQGTSRSPLMPGGGTVFGPRPRSYVQRTPKKVRKAAIRSALALRKQEGKLVILEQFDMDEIKTKRFVELIRTLELSRALIVLPESNYTVEMSARNVKGVKVLPAQGLNLFDILKYETLVLTKGSLERIEGVYGL